MKVLVLHNSYKQFGGEDVMVEQELDLLRSAGHDVRLYTISNQSLVGGISKMRAALGVLSNAQSARVVSDLVTRFSIDLVHVHNFFPQLSPAVHIAASSRGAAVVQTLHNYRLICAAATLFREDKVCEDCLGKPSVRGIVNRCYRNSTLGSTAVVGMQLASIWSKKWLGAVDRFVALSEFGRQKFIEGGLPAEKILVKPNFVSDFGFSGDSSQRENFAVFVGRLVLEKGVRDLITAWRDFPDLELRVVGEGPELEWMRANASPNVSFLGKLSRSDAVKVVRRAKVLVFPSVWYEGFGLTLLEAMSVGTPIAAVNLGAAREVLEGKNFGRLYKAGDSDGLIRAVREISGPGWELRSHSARSEFLNRFSSEVNLSTLEGCYQQALDSRRGIMRS